MTIAQELSAAALDRLEAAIRPYQKLLVAFSGGVDSGVLLAVARKVLGEGAVAITADSPSMARRELREASRFAAVHGVRHLVVKTDELSNESYVRNDTDRCFWCKHTLFSRCEEVAKAEGFPAIAYGYTADDVGDHRPGHRAAEQFGVVAPLHEAGLGKEEIRAIAAGLGLELWDKPAAPCLASRIPYGSEVLPEKLDRIEAMEDLLFELGFRIFRARFDGTLMRVEVGESEIERAATSEVRARLLARSRELSIPLLVLDLEGFRSGKLNRIHS
jgi:uncharacterized protein